MKAASSNFGNKEQIYIKSYCKVNFKLKNNNNHINNNVFSDFFLYARSGVRNYATEKLGV